MSRSLRATLVAAPLFVVATCLEWGGLLSAAWEGDVPHYGGYASRVFGGEIPYHDFYMEYPPGALPAFLLPRLFGEDHYRLVFKLLMIVCWIGAIWAVARILELRDAPMALGLGAMVVTPPLLGHVFLNRYDPYAALLGVVALLALLLRRERQAAAWLSVGFAAKVFTGAALPVAAIRIWRTRGRRRVVEAAGVFVAVGLAFASVFLVVAFGGIGFSYYTQVTRGLQIESLGSSILLVADKLGLYDSQWAPAPPGQADLVGALPDVIGTLSFAVTIVAVLAIAFLYVRGRETDDRLILAFAASIVAYTIFSKVLSPQYLAWLVPLVAVTRDRRALGLLLLALPLTQAEVQWGDQGLRVPDWTVWLLAARNALLVAALVVLVGRLRRRTE